MKYELRDALASASAGCAHRPPLEAQMHVLCTKIRFLLNSRKLGSKSSSVHSLVDYIHFCFLIYFLDYIRDLSQIGKMVLVQTSGMYVISIKRKFDGSWKTILIKFTKYLNMINT